MHRASKKTDKGHGGQSMFAECTTRKLSCDGISKVGSLSAARSMQDCYRSCSAEPFWDGDVSHSRCLTSAVHTHLSLKPQPQLLRVKPKHAKMRLGSPAGWQCSQWPQAPVGPISQTGTRAWRELGQSAQDGLQVILKIPQALLEPVACVKQAVSDSGTRWSN